MEYIVTCDGVENKKGQRFERGETITENDFSKKVLKHWAAIGRIEAVKGEEPPSEEEMIEEEIEVEDG